MPLRAQQAVVISPTAPPALVAGDKSQLFIYQNGGLAVTGTSASVQGTAGALNASVELTVAGAAGAAVQVSGTWVGTLTFQSTINGTDWVTHNGTVYGGASVTNVSTTTANGAWAFRVAGAQKIRATMTAYTSGTATIDIRAATSVGGTASEGLSTQPISGNVTATGVAGAAAAGATASGNPVQVGLVAATAIQTARTAGQIVIPAADKIGRGVGANEQIRDLTNMAPMVTLTATTETTIVAATAAIFNDLRGLILTNTSATATRVDFRTVAAGAVVFSVWLPATTTLTVALPVVAKQATVNTAWTAQLGTAVTDVRITAFTIQAN